MCRPDGTPHALAPDETRPRRKTVPVLLRSDLRLAHVHRARRSLATAATCAGVALGIVVTTGVAAASPLSLPDASASAISTPAFPAVQAAGNAPTLEGVVGAADAALTAEGGLLER